MAYESTAAQPEPPPQPGRQNVADLVMADIQARVDAGLQKYGTKLQTHNGRDALMDAYQEAIDLVMYLRQAMAERDDLGEVKLRDRKEPTLDDVGEWKTRFGKDARFYLGGLASSRVINALIRSTQSVVRTSKWVNIMDLENMQEIKLDPPEIYRHPAFFRSGWPIEFDEWCKHITINDGVRLTSLSLTNKVRQELFAALRQMSAERAN